MTLDPERLATFYEQAFQMTRLTGVQGVPGSTAVYMTDGYITLALCFLIKPTASHPD